MTTIHISSSVCTKGGKDFKFSGGGVSRNGNTYIVSAVGIIATRKGVVETAVIPWSEIDAVVGQHEPKLAIVKKV